MRPNLNGAPRLNCLYFSASSATVRFRLSRPVWRPVVRLSAAGEGLSTDTRPTSQPLSDRKIKKSAKKLQSKEISIAYNLKKLQPDARVRGPFWTFPKGI